VGKFLNRVVTLCLQITGQVVGSSGLNLPSNGLLLVAGFMTRFSCPGGSDRVITASVKPALKEYTACSQTTARNIPKIMSPQ
jgi:hypothetical protein